eukprot:Rmarinus@m.13114
MELAFYSDGQLVNLTVDINARNRSLNKSSTLEEEVEAAVQDLIAKTHIPLHLEPYIASALIALYESQEKAGFSKQLKSVGTSEVDALVHEWEESIQNNSSHKESVGEDISVAFAFSRLLETGNRTALNTVLELQSTYSSVLKDITDSYEETTAAMQARQAEEMAATCDAVSTDASLSPEVSPEFLTTQIVEKHMRQLADVERNYYEEVEEIRECQRRNFCGCVTQLLSNPPNEEYATESDDAKKINRSRHDWRKRWCPR